jgi:pyruvate/2-oxoglutarate dehydrogenase complex dihydrolipoamide acyltransferase (E2) component
MSKLKELVSKGVRLIVVDNEAQAAAGVEETPAAEQEREIPAEAFEAEPRPVSVSAVPAATEDFGAVYQEAGIALPDHGYGVDKVAEMLESKRLAALAPEVKASAVMAALEAAQVSVKDVIQDAVLRDKALDAFEEAKERELKDLRQKSDARIQEIRDEIERFLKDRNAEIEDLKKATGAAQQAFQSLRERKSREEERLQRVVSHFIEGGPNPISTGGRPTSAPTPPAPKAGSA